MSLVVGHLWRQNKHTVEDVGVLNRIKVNYDKNERHGNKD